MDLRAIQAAAVANKNAKDLNLTNVELEFCLLTAEVGEAITSWRRGEDGFDLELADIQLFLVALADMTGVDLQDAVERKMRINADRVYRRDDRGVPIKITEPGAVR
ncbi:hypothetical protein [Streptomyces rimosus]|uniref:hypothetical protein n=1 Tax=Streptomyces rimosus TaxID=1927 RepID=UPI0005B485CA|nr:hypothetical protein [Streptomyces rimosus]